jgi:hypothetical protein
MMIPLLVTFGLLVVGLAIAIYRNMRRQAETDDRIHDRMRRYVGTGAAELPQVALKPLYKIERAIEPEEAFYDRYSVSDILPDWVTVDPSDDELSAWRLLRHQSKETTDKA